MAKILVADDNSNIQKMVGLALKDQGIDVVAVGNGEAAVRKIPDVQPDLVLADVFMPVRNGYEVCEFVKKDPALAHIPVILLVGAFDPLDEQEAQRVGADGVLKKPFVPPDPLIAMVKAALTRAGVVLTGAPEKTEKPAKKAADLLPTRPIPLPMSVQPPPPPPPQAISIEDTDGLVEEVAVPLAPVTMTGGAPLAFGNLMGATETEEDPGFMAPVHPALAMERDWRSAEEDDEVPEEEEEEAPKASWRRDAEDLGDAEPAAGMADTWRESGLKELAAASKGWKSAQESPAMTEAASSATNAAATSVLTEVSGMSDVRGAENASPAFSANAWATAIPAGEEDTPATADAAQARLNGSANNRVAPTAAEAASESPGATLAVEHNAVAEAIERFAVAKDAAVSEQSPLATGSWEAQALKATRLAATWDAPVAAKPLTEEVPSVTEALTPEATLVADEPVLAAGSTNTEHPSAEPSVGEDVAVAARGGVAPDIDATSQGAPFVDATGTSEAESETRTELLAPHGNSTVAVGEPAPAETAENLSREERGGEHTSVLHQTAQGAGDATVANLPDKGDRSPGTPAAEHPDPSSSLGDLAAAVAAQAAESAKTQTSDDVVARVMASLNPDVLQALTREILKPVVEAMVREELNKKK